MSFPVQRIPLGIKYLNREETLVMLRKFRRNELGDGEETEYQPVQMQPFEGDNNAFKFLSKVFSSKNKQKKVKRPKSPYVGRVQHVKTLSPRQQRENVFVNAEGEELAYLTDTDESDNPSRTNSQYNVLFIEGQVNRPNNHFPQDNVYVKRNREVKPNEEDCQIISQNNSYFEVVNVEDRGTDACDLMPEKPEMFDKGTNAAYPRECDLTSCEKEKVKLKDDLQIKDKTIENSLEEGSLLLGDLEKIKRHLFNSGKLPDIINTCLGIKQESPADFIFLSRKCLMELSKHLLSVQRQTEADVQKLKHELNTVKKEKTDREEKCNNLRRKLEVQAEKVNQEKVTQEDSGSAQLQLLQSKIVKLQDAVETGTKIFRDTEKTMKNKIDQIEAELAHEKESNSKLGQALDEKTCLLNKLEADNKRLQNNLDSSKQQLKDIHSSYKSKLAKLELDYTNKMAALCENQTLTNEQLSKSLDRSSNFVNQLQESKKENAALVEANKVLQERMGTMERELTKVREQCTIAERRLARETQEVLSLKSQVDRMETLKEEELLSVDGDIWCQIMYQHDQWILDDLRDSLQDKENYLESLRSQGDCALRDFEKVQNELQQRRQQFNELKDVFLDFEKKRDVVVREQRDFYNKMMLLSKKTIPRDRFFKNLIEECQTKTSRIEELENLLKTTEQAIEETKKISEAQLKAMQAEMKFTAEKLYEFENQIRIKDMQLQEVIRVFEEEKKNKVTAEEAMNTYKILLEDTKKETSELRNKLNYLEDLEKNRTNVLKATEELARETQKRQDTERKLKKLEKELSEMKNILQNKGEKQGESTPHSGKSSLGSKDIDHLQTKIQDLLENKKYMERILMESQRSKDQLQKDHEELYNKMRHAVRVMVESKRNQEELERRLEQRGHTIVKLQKSQADTEDRLDELKDVLHEMKKTIELLYQDREELEHKLSNHMHCHAERAIHQELKLLQRDKAVLEEQNSREKEMLLDRIRDNETTIKDQHKHLRSLQEQLDNVNLQLREAKSSLVNERHNHTQQLLNVQSEKKKLDIYIQELEGRLAYETRLRLRASETMVSSPNYLNSSDSYEPPIRDYNKYHPHRK